MVKIPRGIYKYYSETNTHTIMFYLTDRTFSISCDSLIGLMEIIDWFWLPLDVNNFKTVSEYNEAYQNGPEDTVEIMIPDWEEKKAA